MSGIAKYLSLTLAGAGGLLMAYVLWLVISGQADWSQLLRAVVVVSLLGGSVGGFLQVAAHRPSSVASGEVEEVRLTPAIRDAVQTRLHALRRTFLFLTFGLPAVMVIIGVAVLLFSGDDTAVSILSVFAVVVALIFGILWFAMERPYKKDISATTFLRDAGPIDVISGGQYHRLYIGNRWITVDAVARRGIPTLPHGVVDYTRHARIVLEVRDRQGAVVYRDRYYEPAARASGE